MMKTIFAGSVGMNWRSDVGNAAHYGPVEVVDLRGQRLAIVSTSKDSIGRESWYLNGKRCAYAHIWEAMHKWSNVIAEQQAIAFKANCKHIANGRQCVLCLQSVAMVNGELVTVSTKAGN